MTWQTALSTLRPGSRNGRPQARSSAAFPPSWRDGTSPCERRTLHASPDGGVTRPSPYRKAGTMAGRILNRRELRQQADVAEQIAPDGATAAAVVVKPKRAARAKGPAVPKVRKP